ncbi:SDR family NAD(P)-dependent oxidoreductase [Gordonia neofelifaecis]|uniref:Short-chain dehydrogenase/reductase SDR n=1 Tax=Gordonia neofelifaecis NRRL B-59395 TaxID=644548 RepID=F1YNV7_9ACTN|nr:SDR family oxidoreductase [Gordonia neofelifaecis]EGD53576.1 short-chain dehydrogenase/reductase SDR [Gordonia neofelifaecis NRRL B-59395]
MTDRLAGKTAYITGAGSGIGEATALRFGAEGANVVVTDLNGDAAASVADRIVAAGGAAISHRVDVTVPDDHAAVVAAALRSYGRIDVLHNNAGIVENSIDTTVVDTPDSAWRTAFEVDLLGVVNGTRVVLPEMVRTGGGSVINTASAAPFNGNTTMAAYGSVKGAVIALTRYVATSHGRHNIRCNAIAPGLVLSPGALEVFPVPGLLDAIAKHQTVPGFCAPDDVAHLAVFLGSDESRFISGQTHIIDSGLMAMGAAVPDIDEVLASLGTPTTH